jgi:hypothetical protein
MIETVQIIWIFLVEVMRITDLCAFGNWKGLERLGSHFQGLLNAGTQEKVHGA